MKTSLCTAAVWAFALSLFCAGAGWAAQDEGPSEGTPCDYIYVFVSQEGGPTYVFNFTDQPITFNLQTVQSICTSARCTYTSTYNNLTLEPGELGSYEFVPDRLDIPCLLVYCCGTGSVGQAWATLTFPAGQCQSQAESVRWDTCGSININ